MLSLSSGAIWKERKLELLSNANIQILRLDSREDKYPYGPRMSTGLTGESPSDELVLVLSCKLVFYFIVGGMKNLRGRMGYVHALKVASVHIFLF